MWHGLLFEPFAMISAFFVNQSGRLAFKEFFPKIEPNNQATSEFMEDTAYEYSSIIQTTCVGNVDVFWQDLSHGIRIILPNGSQSNVRIIDEEYELRGNCCADRAIRVAQGLLNDMPLPSLNAWHTYKEFCDAFRSTSS